MDHTDATTPERTEPVFAPPSDNWRRISPKLATTRRISLSIWLGVLFIPAAVASWFLFELWFVPALIVAVGLALWAWLFVRAGRLVASYGYAERDADLCVTHGLMFRQLLVVPFGRMQVIKVSSGPLLRAYGLATVQLVTASAQTDAVVPGLPLDDARALRDRLIELSDAKGSGL